MRGMEILKNLGCDIRILQLDGDAKDPDEYVIKYGSGRFEKCVENAISLVEFKVKTLKKSMNIQTASDKIKFLTLKETLNTNTDIVMMKYNVGFDENGNVNFSYYRERLLKREKNYLWKSPIH